MVLTKTAVACVAVGKRRHVAWLVAAAAAAILGCGDDIPGRTLPSFNDIPSATPAIIRAASAVVRVRSAGRYGTGSFISPNGQLLTNSHVLGVPVCPLEGCSIELTFLHQRGQVPGQKRTVWAVPIVVDVGLDMAILQISEDYFTIAQPNYLGFRVIVSTTLM